MKKYICDVCGWEYDPALGVEEAGIAPGKARHRTSFLNL